MNEQPTSNELTGHIRVGATWRYFENGVQVCPLCRTQHDWARRECPTCKAQINLDSLETQQ